MLQVDALNKVLEELLGEGAAQKKAHGRGSSSSSSGGGGDDLQLDNILPPEVPTNWVQCEACHKWRRVPWNVDCDALSEEVRRRVHGTTDVPVPTPRRDFPQSTPHLPPIPCTCCLRVLWRCPVGVLDEHLGPRHGRLQRADGRVRRGTREHLGVQRDGRRHQRGRLRGGHEERRLLQEEPHLLRRRGTRATPIHRIVMHSNTNNVRFVGVCCLRR